MQQFSGSLLKARREAAGKRREQVAVDIGKSYSSVQLYERGVVYPPVSTITKLAFALGCEVADFFEEVVAHAV